MLNNGGGTSFAGHLGDGVDSGCAVNLGDNMASLNRSDNWFDDGNINTMFAGVFSARSFDGFGFKFGKSIGYGSGIS